MDLKLSRKEVADLLDHTLLKPTATAKEIEALCNEAMEYGFFSVCVNPCYVKLAKKFLADTNVKVCTVVGFPLGANTTAQKQREAEEALQNGASEIDMVVALGAIKGADWDYVRQDIAAVKKVTGDDALLKVILETGLLIEPEITEACMVAKEAGADFLKTSTGFSGVELTLEEVGLMRLMVGQEMGVKAAGGIKNLQQVHLMVGAGASRIGSSAGVSIMSEFDN